MLIFLCIVVIIILCYFVYDFYVQKKELKLENEELKQTYSPIIDIYAEYKNTQHKIETMEKDYNSKLSKLQASYKEKYDIYKKLEEKIELYTDDLEMIDVGLYKPIYNYDTSEKYKIKLEENRTEQKKLIKDGEAVYCNTNWQVGGSKSEGKKMTNRTIKLVLKAFNGQCDSIIKNVNWNNVYKMEDRIEKAFDDINKLCETNDIHINDEFLELKIAELRLAYEYEQKKYDEKEEQRRIREQIREEEKLQKEIERKQKEIEEQQKQEEEIQKLLKQAYEQGKQSEVDKYQEEINRLNEEIENSKRAVSQAQMTKLGHVYVISNIGSFGENIYKIGMTRRLDPQERVDELGDASVPFKFDIHAMIKSDNAPELENKLHELFKNKSVNRINYRKEFFNVTLEEIQDAVKQYTNSEIEFTKIAEAKEYRETQAIVKAESNNINSHVKTNELPLEI